MLDFKRGYRYVGTINTNESSLISILIKNGYRLFINELDVFLADIYFKDSNAI